MAAQVGETYAFKIFGGGYGAVQVAAEKTVSRNLRELLLLRLDIDSAEPPTAARIHASKPAQWLWSIDDFAPWWAARIDNAELLDTAIRKEAGALGQWENIRMEAMLSRRMRRPAAPPWRRDAQSIVIDLGGKPANFHPNQASVDLRPLLPAANVQPNWAALRELPNLRMLTHAGAERGLTANLDDLLRLTWHAPTENVLDLRHTRLIELSVLDIGAPLTVLLPAACARFVAGGRCDLVSVHAPDTSEGFSLHLWGASSQGLPNGLDAIEEVALHQRRRVDAAALLRWPRLKSVAMHGACELDNIGALRDLKGLRRFDGSDLYGFDAAAFPTADDCPLYDVTIDGLHADDAKILRKRLAGLPRARFTKMRTDKWLAENLDNPFRDWDADGAAFGKAAMKLWRDAVRAAKSVDGNARTECARTAVLDLVAGLNQLATRHEIDTLRREQACDAICALVSAHLGGALNAKETQELVDQAREW